MKPSIQDHTGVIRQVPIIYNGAQKWVQIRRRSYLVDQQGTTLYPLISFSRTNTATGDEPPINKAWAMYHRNFIQVDNKYYKPKPFEQLSTNNIRNDYYKINIPIQVACEYSFQIYTDNNWQMNQILQTFMIHNKIWWIIDGYRVKVKFGDFSNTAQLETGAQRLIKAEFSLETKSIIYPKDLRVEQKERKDVIVNTTVEKLI